MMLTNIPLPLVILGSSVVVNALQVTPPTFLLQQRRFVLGSNNGIITPTTTPTTTTSALFMAQKKGFDKTSNSSTKKKSKPTEAPPPSSSMMQDTTDNMNDNNDTGNLNAGQIALERMRAKQSDEKDAELRKVKEVRSVDEFIREDPDAAVIPERVAMRMGSRMLPFVGIPLFGTMGAFVAFWYLRVYKNIEFETVSVAFVTIGLLVVGLLGITYSVMSASWDSDREGSALGVDEFSNNLDSIRAGLKRSKENLIIREQMAGLPEGEIEAAIRALDKKDERAKMKKMSLEEKMKKELE